MAKSKATHYGECQCCGSRQKLPGGVLSLHGYTVNKKHGYGFFQGTCVGSSHLPFEKSTDLIESFIRTTEKQKAYLQEKVNTLRQPTTEETKVWLHLYVRGDYGIRGYYAWFEVTMTMETRKAESGDYEFHDFYYDNPIEDIHDRKKGDRVILRDSYNYNYPKSIAELAKNANEKYAQSLEKNIVEAQKYIDWQTERVNNWTEKPLTPIK